MQFEHRMEVFACRSSRGFAEKVVEAINQRREGDEPLLNLGALEVSQFSDGEFQPAFTESVRGAMVFIISSTFPPADNLMELLLTIDAAKRASASKVIAVMPYFGWARQDRKDRATSTPTRSRASSISLWTMSTQATCSSPISSPSA